MLLLLFCSCGEAGRGVWYDGRELTESELEVLLANGRETEETEETAAVKELVAFREDALAPNGESVFWTKDGGVFHLSPLCQHLSKASEIYYGTAEDAVTEGKERACKACEKENRGKENGVQKGYEKGS